MATAKFGEYTYNVDSKGIPYGNPLPSGTAVTTTAPQWQQPTQAEAIANVTKNTPAAYKDQVLAQVNANPQAYKPTQTITPTDVTTPTPTIPTTPTDTTDYSSILSSLTPGDNAQQLIDKSAQSQNDLFKQMTDLIGTPPSQADAYAEAQNQAGIVEKQKVVSDLTAQLNGITANSQAGQLTQEGKAIPLGIIGGRQAEIAREAAIKALPVSAQLQAAQGNLQMAQENLNTMFELKSADMTAQYNYKTQLVQSIYSLASDQEKTKLDYVLSLEERKYNEQQSNQQAIQEIALEAVRNGASSSTLSAIYKATDINSAISAAGSSLVPKKEPTAADEESAEIQSISNTFKMGTGSDGFVDPYLYRRLRAESDMTPSQFDARFSYFVNNVDPKAYEIVGFKTDSGEDLIGLTSTKIFELQSQGVDIEAYKTNADYRDAVNSQLAE